jgi:hypothetical protein
MDTLIETFTHMDVRCELHQDVDPHSCLEWDNLGIMYCWHPDYTLGDEQFTRDDHGSMADVVRYLWRERDALMVMPLFLLDHSGLSIRTGAPYAKDYSTPRDLSPRDRFVGDYEGWDTTLVGFIFTNPERVAVCGTPEHLFEQCLRSEVANYDNYLKGNVVGYIVDPGGANDSCWGFYPDEDGDGLDYARIEARAAAEAIAEQREKESREASYWAARDVLTVTTGLESQ